MPRKQDKVEKTSNDKINKAWMIHLIAKIVYHIYLFNVNRKVKFYSLKIFIILILN